MKNLALKARIIEKFGAQFKFSHAIGVPEATVSRVINDVFQIRDSEKERWAKALHCKVTDVFFKE